MEVDMTSRHSYNEAFKRDSFHLSEKYGVKGAVITAIKGGGC